MTYFLAYTEKPDPPVLRLATTGACERCHHCCWGVQYRIVACFCCRAAPVSVTPTRCPCPLPTFCRRGQASAHVGGGQLEALCQGAAAAEGDVPQHRVGALGGHRPGGAPLAAAGHRWAGAGRAMGGMQLAWPARLHSCSHAPSPRAPPTELASQLLHSVLSTLVTRAAPTANCHPAPPAGEAPLVLGLDPATGGLEWYAGLEGKIDPGQKKVPKVYHLAVHPTR